MAYLAVRCMPHDRVRDEAFEAGHQRFPTSAWFANAAAFSAAEHGRYAEALAAYRVAAEHGPALRAAAAKEIVRLERLLDPSAAARDQERLAAMSPSLKNMLLIEGGAIMPEGPERSLVLLARGRSTKR